VTGPGRPALRRCVAADPDLFARELWSRAPVLSTYDALGAVGFADLFSLEAVDELLSRRGLRTPFIRIARNGELVGERRFTRSGGTGATIADQVADDRVLALFADGHTVVLQGLHRLWPPLIDFAGSLTSDLGHPVQINAYVTPPASRGFSAHYDVHDVFVLQVAGEKRWRIHEPVLREPLRSQPWTDRRAAVEARATEPSVIDEVLRPGDALYLPRGYLHAAEALGGVSCHLTVGIHPITRQAVLASLVALLGEDSALRASLPLGVDLSDPAAIEADVQATVAVLTERLRSVSPAEVAQRLAERSVASTRPAPIAPLAQAGALATLDGASVLVGRGHLQHAVRDDGDEVVLTLPDRTLRLPAAHGKALRATLDGARIAVRDLPGLDLDAALALAGRLVREGIAVLEVPTGTGTGPTADHTQ
jgi:hypothetical protein